MIAAILYSIIGLGLAAGLIALELLKPGNERERWRNK